MPGLKRHVHFDDNSSPTSSSSSLPSSDGPITPPPHGFGSPYHPTSLSLMESNAYVNPILATSNRSFDFDISKSPTSITYYATLSKSVWEQPATQPAAHSMVVVCDRLPWVLTILPGGNQQGYVTVWDFIHGLYSSLRQSVSKTEFSTLSPEGQDAVAMAYKNRCKYFFEASQYDAEMMKGVKRVDFLVGHSIFSGIKIGKGGRWDLMVR
ncbi:hypothetical protein CVT25_004638 [Psilocybe cyanescens]|uniref:DUF6699 domain-containing protein n=1 Tax=Psilocybe cyanescens TaxID=93625 RepID=A0A409VT10_PSICY|nr:hypothetical protein CVT25_004638 [Psilocybe cyanescens]